MTVSVRLRCAAGVPRTVRLSVGEVSTALNIAIPDGTDVPDGTDGRHGSVVVTGTVRLADVDRWWPRGYGPQPRYPVSLDVDGTSVDLGLVGFRTVAVDRADGGFQVIVNGSPVFCRGACWGAPDVVSCAAPADEVRQSLLLAVDAGVNMLRVPAYTWYEDATFWEACDELGILVWQDIMIAGVDPPEDPAFSAALEDELRQVFTLLQGRPALAVVCGGSESQQQPAMFGLPASSWSSTVLDVQVPALVDELLPGVPYVPSSPTSVDGLPFRPGSGVAHYFGVGAYLRPLTDARLADVRFAAECLSFGTPPEDATVREVFGSDALAGHDPRWKLTVARDSGTSWDFEDVRDHYVRTLFGVSPFEVRYSDPSRALDLGRAAVGELMTAVLAEWRRAGSRCAGAIVLTWQDIWPGAGWGVVDALGRPKSSWYALRRAFAPNAVSFVDEGLGGLALHVYNDGPTVWSGRLTVRTFGAGGATVDDVQCAVAVDPHGQTLLDTETLLGGFRDLTRAYRFGPSAHDVVAAELSDEDGRIVGDAVHLPDGLGRPRLPGVGLNAHAHLDDDGVWWLTVSTELFAQSVAVDVSGYRPADSWFHLPPRTERVIRLHPTGSTARPRGTVRALNALESTKVTT